VGRNGLESNRQEASFRPRLRAWPARPADPGAEKLAERAARGDRDAFEQIVHRFQRRIYGFAYRYVRDADEAQDLAQEVFLRLYRKLGRFDPRRPFEPWLWRVAANVCANYRSKRVSTPPPLQGADEEAGAASAPSLFEETTLGAALSQLPPANRHLLALHYQADMPLAEIADTLGVSQVTVKSRLYRARVQLQHVLVEQT
jgi:RNA polymerase sigma-70 factor, ECF subfamily